MKKIFSVILMMILVTFVSGCSLFNAGAKSTNVTYLAFIELTERSDVKDMFDASTKIVDIELSEELRALMEYDSEASLLPQKLKIKYSEQLVKDENIYDQINYAVSLVFTYHYANLNLSNSASKDFSAALYDTYIDYKNSVYNMREAILRLENVSSKAGFIVNSDKSLSAGAIKEFEDYKAAYNRQIRTGLAFSKKYVSFLKTYIFNSVQSPMPPLMLLITEQLKVAELVFNTIDAFNETNDTLISYNYEELTSNGSQVTMVEKTASVNYFTDLIVKLYDLNTDIKSVLATIAAIPTENPVVPSAMAVNLLENENEEFVENLREFDISRNYYLQSVSDINTDSLTLSEYLSENTLNTLNSSKIIYMFDYITLDFEVYLIELYELMNAIEGTLI